MRTLNGFILAVAAAGVLVGCSKAPEKKYSPLVPEKAAIVGYCPVESIFANKDVKAFLEKSAEVLHNKDEIDKVLDDCPEFKGTVIETLAKMDEGEAFKYVWGIPESSVKWELFTVVPAQVSDGETFVRCPDFACVICCDETPDVAGGYDRLKEIFLAMFKVSLAGVGDGADFDERMEGFAKCVKCEKGLYEGQTAVRFTLTQDVLESLPSKAIQRFSPIMTTLCEGKLLVFASSEEHLAEIAKIYKGELPAAPADSKIARELTLPNATFLRFSIVDVLNSIKAFLTDSQAGVLESMLLSDENSAKQIKAVDVARFEMAADPANEAFDIRIQFAFNDPAIAVEVNEMLNPLFAMAKMAVAAQQDDVDPSLAVAMPVVNSLSLQLDGSALGVSMKLPIGVLSELAKMEPRFDGFGEDDCPDCGVFPDEDEIDEIDEDVEDDEE